MIDLLPFDNITLALVGPNGVDPQIAQAHADAVAALDDTRKAVADVQDLDRQHIVMLAQLVQETRNALLQVEQRLAALEATP